jgi:hypothetical protein
MKKLLFTSILLLAVQLFNAQDLLDVLESETPETKNIVTSTFKGTRILNGHSIENRKAKELEFVISHRFGRINLGFDELYGLDQSNIRFALEYGLNNNITVGLGRSSFDKTYDAFLKYALLRQTKGKNAFPVAISFFGSVANKTLKDFAPENPRTFTESLSYVGQVLIARKFSKSFSFQITPTYVHSNSVKQSIDPHDVFALGFGTRVKVSNRVSVNAEYYNSFDKFQSFDATNSLAFGVDIETGGHVFQLILSNSITMIEKSFITETTGNFFKGDIHFGFNISRTF